MSCTICDWPDGEILAAETLAKAFFVRSPARPGHIAVAARAHKPTLVDLDPDEAAAVLRLAHRVAVAAAPLLGIEKFYLAAVGDVDPHFHIHLLPKKIDDPRLGPYLFSPSGWQGHEGVARDATLEERIARVVREQ
ncbi:MAG TPA: HIT family protein [Thermoanaerobaculia bacterium]